MPSSKNKTESQLALQQRIQQLEQENKQLLNELDSKAQTERLRTWHERLYRILAANLPNGAAFLLDRDFRYLLADGQALQMVGLSPADLEDKTIWEALDADTAARYETLYKQALDGESFIWEHHDHGRDYISRGVPILGENGEITAALALSYDITERKQVERALLESEVRFRTMADGTPVMIWVTDAQGQMEFINKSYTEFFDVSLEEVKSGTWQMLVHPEDRAAYVDEFLSCIRERRPFQAQCRVGRKDGQWRWIASHGQPRVSEDGTFLGMAGSSMDVTERRQAEDALLESQRMLADAQRIAGVGSWRWNIQSGELHWSDELYAIYEMDRDTFSPSIDFFSDHVHPEDRQLIEHKMDEIKLSGTPVDFEFRIVSGTGRVRILRTVGQITQYDPSGNPCIMVGANQDITERKRAEQDLKASEEHFRVAIKNSPIVVYTTDRELRYTWIYNPPFGADAAQILGKTDEELNGPDNVAEISAFKRSVLETGIGRRQEIEWRYQGGTYFYDVTAEPLRNDEDGIIGLTVALIDITERKKLEQSTQEQKIQIELQRRLIEQREQERLSIAQEIHDGPAQTLVGELLLIELARNSLDPELLRANLDRTESTIHQVVQELRDVVGRLRPPLLEQFGLSEAMRFYAKGFDGKHHSLQVVCEIEEGLRTLSEEVSLNLFRIYQESLSNIVRHAHATKARVSLNQINGRVLLEIEDDGTGMPEDPNPISQATEGHYGLAGMRERADTIGGELQVKSVAGRGTVIRVIVPFRA